MAYEAGPVAVETYPPDDMAAYDLPTLDKIPKIKALFLPGDRRMALDIGIGTGFTTSQVFADTPTVCVDLHLPNLLRFRSRTERSSARQILAVVARADALPLRSGTIGQALCSEVLEHLDDDEGAVCEIARTLQTGGRFVVTVPYSGFRATGLPQLLGLKTVHDYPGPECHVRPGYDESSISALLRRSGLLPTTPEYYLRLCTKALVDLVTLAHMAYQRTVHKRRHWTWAEAASAESGATFGAFKAIFPILVRLSRLDRFLQARRGFGLVIMSTKPAPSPPPT